MTSAVQKYGFPIPREHIRICIKGVGSERDLRGLITMCMVPNPTDDDKSFVQECLSEIEHRKKGADYDR